MPPRKKSLSDAKLGLTGNPGVDDAIARAEQALAAEVAAKDDPNADPISLGPRVLSADQIAEKLVRRASDAAEEWLVRVKAPKKHPIQEGIKAEGKYADKMKTVIAEGRRAKSLSKVTDDDYIAGIDAAGSSAFREGIERKRGKVQRRMAVLQPLYEVLAKAIDTLPTDTESQREAKMRAARRGMIMVGKARRGEVGPAEISAEISKLKGGA